MTQLREFKIKSTELLKEFFMFLGEINLTSNVIFKEFNKLFNCSDDKNLIEILKKEKYTSSTSDLEVALFSFRYIGNDISLVSEKLFDVFKNYYQSIKKS